MPILIYQKHPTPCGICEKYHVFGYWSDQIEKRTLQVANKEMLESLQHGGEKELKTYIYRKMWLPDYR